MLVLLLAYAGFASPLVVLITFAGSLCCALSIGEFAGRLPSAGWAYTYNSRWLGPAAGFLTGWMMIFGYVLFVPAGVALTSAFGSLLVASTLHLTISPWILFLVVLAAARPRSDTSRASGGCRFPGDYTLTNLLPFIAFGWLLAGVIAAAVLRARRPATFATLGESSSPAVTGRPLRRRRPAAGRDSP